MMVAWLGGSAAALLAAGAFAEAGVYQGTGYSIALPDGCVAQTLKVDEDADEHLLVYPSSGGSEGLEAAPPSEYGRRSLIRLDVTPNGADKPTLDELRKETTADLKDSRSTADIETIDALSMPGLYVRVSAPKAYDYFILLGTHAVYELTSGPGNADALSVVRSLKETSDPFAGKKLVKLATAADDLGKGNTRRGRRRRERPADAPPTLRAPREMFYSDSGYSFALPARGRYLAKTLESAAAGEEEHVLVFPASGKANRMAKAMPASFGKLKLMKLDRLPFEGGRTPTLDEVKERSVDELGDDVAQIEKIEVLSMPGYYFRITSPRPYDRFVMLGHKAVYVWTTGPGSRAALEVVKSFKETAARDPFAGKKLADEKPH